MAKINEAGSVVLDGSGNGTIRLGQVPTGQKRDYTRIALRIDTGDASAGGIAEVYAGDPLPANYVEGSVSPWQDAATFSDSACQVIPPEQLTIVFTGCDPGATAHVTTSYTRTP